MNIIVVLSSYALFIVAKEVFIRYLYTKECKECARLREKVKEEEKNRVNYELIMNQKFEKIYQEEYDEFEEIKHENFDKWYNLF